MAKIGQDKSITKGMVVRPNQAPMADNIFISPPPRLSGCFFINNKEATTGIVYPNIAPSALFAVDEATS